MQAPKIKTAIPKRRYTLGDYAAVILGAVESDDSSEYRYILAMVREGESQPRLYVTAEKTQGDAAAAGTHQLRVVSEIMTETLDTADKWSDLEIFSEQALSVAAKALGLTDEQPVRLM